MDSLERRKFELHAETDGYRERVEQAEEWINRIFDRYDTPYISVSGGKDSTVLHHLVSQRCGYTDVDIFHFDWGVRNIPGVEDHIKNLADRFGGNLIVRTSEGVQKEAFARDEHNGMQGIFGWTRKLGEERGWTASLLGIRAEESPRRRDQYTGKPPSTSGPVCIQFAPIHKLQTQDVWAYIVEHDLAYHEIYDEQAELYGSIDAKGNRLVTLYDSEFDSLGSRTISQFIYPSRTNELKEIEKPNHKEIK